MNRPAILHRSPARNSSVLRGPFHSELRDPKRETIRYLLCFLAGTFIGSGLTGWLLS